MNDLRHPADKRREERINAGAADELKERWRRDDALQQSEDFQKLLCTAWGRRIYNAIASIGGVYCTHAHGDERFEYAAGKRDCALRFMHLCRASSPADTALALSEAADTAQARRDELDKLGV